MTKPLLHKIILRFGAFIAVMAICYGIVMAGAWHSSVLTPTLSVSLPSFSMIKKSPVLTLHTKKANPCPLPPAGALKAGACETETHMCGRHDCDSSDATSLYCGCHGHGDGRAGATASGAPYAIPSTMERAETVLAMPFFSGKPSPREIIFVVKIERPPSFLPV